MPIAAFHPATAEPGAPGAGAGAGLLDDAPAKGKKKQTPNVRRLIIYKKTLREYINEMVCPVLPLLFSPPPELTGTL